MSALGDAVELGTEGTAFNTSLPASRQHELRHLPKPATVDPRSYQLVDARRLSSLASSSEMLAKVSALMTSRGIETTTCAPGEEKGTAVCAK